MWRWILLAVVVMALSAAATVAVQFLPASSANQIGPVADSEPKGPPPYVEMEEDLLHKFGTMAQEDFGYHEWVLKNSGEGDLKLSQGEHECSCTIASLKEGQSEIVKPGKSTKVQVKWETRKNNGAFEKSSTIVTNDPEHPVIRFQVSGTVRPAVSRFPQEEVLDFGSIANDKDQTKPLVLFSADRPKTKFKVVSRRPDMLEIKSRPLNKAEMESLHVEAGEHLDLILKPGNNLGTFTAEVAVETDHPKQSDFVIPLTGRIVGPISALPEALRIAHISGPKGGQGRITLTVRDHDKTEFTVVQKPDKVDVTISAIPVKTGVDPAQAKTRQYLMTVSVPPGTSPGEILGAIMLKTDHPKASQVKIPLDLLVLGE